MSTIIALAGNPNCGKTTLFNELTGSNQYVGNWPGVTVEEKNGKLKGEKDVIIQDLPGIYSLSPYSLEERVSRKFLVEKKPAAILNIVDGMNIERNLYLTTQLAEIGVPMVIAVNMMDLVKRNGDEIDFEKLSKRLNCKVIGISAQKGKGCLEASKLALDYAKAGHVGEVPHVFTGSVEHALAHIEESIQGKVPEASIRWHAIKIFERDSDAIKAMNLDPAILAHVEGHIADCEKELDDDSESIITAQRYEFIQKLVKECVKKNEKARAKTKLSDKIDRFVTNRFLAIPIFCIALVAMYWLAVADGGPGTKLTDWANDGLLGDGWFVPFTERQVDGKSFEDASDEFAKADAAVQAWEAEGTGPKVAHLEDEDTGEYTEEWEVTEAEYKAAKEVEEPDPSKYGVWVPGVANLAERFCEKFHITGLAAAIINNGIVGGVCTVLGFVPVIAIVFLFLAFLEDCGYMARVAFIMDRLFRGFGLSGKSFIPMLVGKGCGVPAVMAARTIENKRDQRMTIILATFMPCGAKTVIITMFTAIFFREFWWVAAAMDLTGVAIIVLGGIALKKTRPFAGEAAPFVMELPAYHLPTFKGVIIHTWERVKAYAWKAGLIIFPCCVVLTFMMTFDWHFNVLEEEQIGQSILASIGGCIKWFFAPLGFGTWEGATATLSAEIAKEQATATLAMVAGGDGSAAANVSHLFSTFSDFPKLSALAFLTFNLFVPPCLVAIVNTFKEMGSKAWGWFAIGFQLLVGYVIALNCFQIGKLCASGSVGLWTVITFLVDIVVIYFIFRPMPKSVKESK